MAELKVNLTDGDLASAMQAAMIASLSEGAKERMLADALAYLVTPVRQEYGNRQTISPLQEAINQAMLRVATSIVDEQARDPESEIHKAIQELVNKAMATMRTAHSYETLGELLGKALIKVLGQGGY